MNIDFKTKRILIIAVIVILTGFVWISAVNYFCEGENCFVLPWGRLFVQAQVKDFDDCAEKGYLVTEGFPPQCRAGQQTFTQSLLVKHSSKLEIDKLRIVNPVPNQLISSPLEIMGQARGEWYFEASFPIKLLDGNNNEVAHTLARAQSDWTTPDFVPFVSNLKFGRPTTPTGSLVFQRDNPSSLDRNEEVITLPVRFEDK